MTLYKHLNLNAKSWWYFKKLRSRGDHSKARELERESILRNVEDIRSALSTPNSFITVGRAGVSVHFGNKMVSGYSLDHVSIAKPLMHMGILTIDSRTVPEENLIEYVMRLPIPVTDNSRWDDCPLSEAGPLTYVSPSDFASLAERKGATVTNKGV